MRALNIAVAARTLQGAPARAGHECRRLGAVAPPAEHASVVRQRVARIAALWPSPTRQCVAAAIYHELPAPAMFGMLFQVSWPPQAMQSRLREASRGAGRMLAA